MRTAEVAPDDVVLEVGPGLGSLTLGLLPAAASADEQTYRAQLLYQRSGAGQWPHCGPRLFN